MSTFLLKLLELSLQAGVLIAAILIIRLVFRKLPAKYLCILWMIVAARLVIPFSVESSVAPMWTMADFARLFPGDGEICSYHVETEVFSANEVTGERSAESSIGSIPGMDSNDEVDYYISDTNDEVDYYITDGREGVLSSETEDELDYYITTVKYQDSVKEGWMQAGSEQIRIRPDMLPAVVGVWTTGLGILLLYGVFSCFKVRRMVKNAILYEDNVWLCEGLDSPFLFGWVHPRIYLPTNLEEQQLKYVIEHEKSHIARGDNYAKLVGYLLLAVHWFNPLVWMAYVMFCKDVERACDERVIANFDVEERKGYADALLQCSVDCRFAISHPLAFGETDVKKRITGILKYRKAGKWMAVIAVLLCVATVAGCFVVQKSEQNLGQQVEVSPLPVIEISPTPAPTVGPSSEERGNGPFTPIPTEAAKISSTPLPPSDLELLGKVTSETVLPVPIGQTVEADLDGDGTAEKITFGIEGYEKNISYRELVDSYKYTRTDIEDLYSLQINDTVFSRDDIREEYWDDNPSHTTYYIFDVNLKDERKEIGLYFDGPSGDPVTALYRYENDKLYCIGVFCSETLYSDRHNSYEQEQMSYMEMVQKVDREEFMITVPGDGTILCRERIHMFETSETVTAYALKNASYSRAAYLEETIRDRYEFTCWQNDRGDMYVKAARSFYAYASPVDMSVEERKCATAVQIPEGTRISFYAYYPDNGWTAGWVQFAYGENLEHIAWFYKGVDVKGKFLIYLPNTTEDDTFSLFEDLSMAG